MALNITGTIELDNGITLSSIYSRVNPELESSGARLRCIPEFWATELDFKNGKTPISWASKIPTRFDYDRLVDGSDLLTISNEKIKEQLELKGYSVVITEL